MLDALYLAVALSCVGFYSYRLRNDAAEVIQFTLFVGGLAAGIGALLGMAFEDPFGVIRLQAWGLFVVCPLWCYIAAFLTRIERPRIAAGHAALATLAVAIGVDAFLYEPTALEINHVEIRTEKRDKPLRIAVLSDLQTDRIGDYERRAVRTALAERPDVLLLPGDYIQGLTRDDHERLIPQLRQMFQEERIGAPQGAWAVEGNVEYRGRWPEIFDGTGVQAIVKTETFAGDGFKVTALSFADSFDPELAVAPVDGFHVVFGHGPDFALGAVDADLLVAGHTHGGQVRLPIIGPLLTYSTIPRAWAAGVTALSGGRTLVVSRGVGMERAHAPRLRFRCKPEIVIIDVLPET